MSEAERGKMPIFGPGSNPWVPRTIECKKKYGPNGPNKARTAQNCMEGETATIAPRVQVNIQVKSKAKFENHYQKSHS